MPTISVRTDRHSSLTPEALNEMYASAIRDVRVLWQRMDNTVSDMPLVQRIRVFSQPVHVLLFAKYSPIMHPAGKILWSVIFTALLEAKTHSMDELRLAVEAIDKLYNERKAA